MGTKERILDRALYLFGKNSSLDVSVRTIVSEAKVNIGAINYYFGSKENMINKVKEFYIENIYKAYSPLYNEELNDKQKLVKCAKEIINYSIKYPGVLIINKKILESEFKSEIDIKIIESLNQVNLRMDEVLKMNMTNVEDFIVKKSMFISSIYYPFLDDEFISFSKEIKSSIEKREEYVDKVISILLK